MAVIFAVSCAVTYGFADFSGGLASRRANPLAVTAGAQLVGMVLAPLAVLAIGGTPDGMLLSIGAGVFGGLGLLLYFTGLSQGAMGVVSPLSAAAAAGVPVAAGLGMGERPTALALLGITVAIPAIWLASRPAPEPSATADPRPEAAGALPPGVLLGLLSGLAFGLFFVLLDQTPADSGAWPLIGSKIGSLGVVVCLALARRQSLVPARVAWPLVAASGVLDVTANLLFLLASREGLLSLVSAISSQYPVVVVILSVLILRERLGRSQQAGVLLALVAVGLISVG